MGNDKETALCYPYIDINDADLIKTSALYWDEVQTIVPDDEIQKGHKIYNTEISIEAEKEGFLKARIVNATDEVLLQAGTEVIEDIDQTPQILDKIAKIIRTPVRPQKRKRPKFSTIHIEKFNPITLLHLKDKLDRANITITPKDSNCDELIVPTPFADMYMSRLASIIATKDGTVPLTNESLWQDAVIDRYIDYSEELKLNQSQLAKLSLQTISIAPDVPLIDVIKFRNKHRDMLVNFRSYIHELSWQVARGLDTPEKQDIFEEILKIKVLPVKEEIEAKLSEGDILFGLSSFDIVQAAAWGAFASKGIDWRTGIIVAGTRLAVSLYKSIREDRNIIRDHPLGYLYKAQKKFGQNR